MTRKPNNRATVYEILAERIEPRLRRLEITTAVLVVAVALPKLGGPTVPQVAQALARFLT